MYDVLIQRSGEQLPTHHVKTFQTEDLARAFCGNLANFPADTIHYAITCEDGRTILDTSRAS